MADTPPDFTSTINQMVDALKGGEQAIVGGLGIPQEEVKNAAGQVVFPTNALEKGLQGSDDAAQQFAGAFIGPGKLMLGPTGAPQTFYHGTSHPNIKNFEVGYNSFGNKDFSGNHKVLSFATDPEFANRYAGEREGSSVYPVNLKANNPGDFRDPNHVEQVIDLYKNNKLKWLEDAKAKYPEVWTPDKITEFLKKEHADTENSVKQGAWTHWENPAMWDKFGFDSAWTRETPGHAHQNALNFAVGSGDQVVPLFVKALKGE